MSACPCCLVVEDRTLVAASIEMSLANAGIPVQTVATLVDARAWLEKNTAHIAVVDLMLQDRPMTEFAGEFDRRGIPLVIYSGCSQGQEVPTRLQREPRMETPTAYRDLLRVVLKTLMELSS
ncbi:hypothetical protein [Microvirga mediterraneensis]|uniref:Response regulator receiver domain-containing protein n=1 Tax=Microvirga mediterraneensis TaxID=2754695 RepID=A0A838BUN0_9HYPH|nr:hypothetical protein [Microvirga mediterraneensis]MBA1159131.1 hypothetical protein [Microvirga mediterraneensis]